MTRANSPAGSRARRGRPSHATAGFAPSSTAPRRALAQVEVSAPPRRAFAEAEVVKAGLPLRRRLAPLAVAGVCVATVVAGTSGVAMALTPPTLTAHATLVTDTAGPEDQVTPSAAVSSASQSNIATAQLVAARTQVLEQTATEVQEQQQAAREAEEAARAAAELAAQQEADRLKELSVFKWPTAGSVSSGFGMRMHPILHVMKMHEGDDIGGACGQPIWAAQSGTVTAVAPTGDNGGAGHNVRIDHGEIDGVHVESRYLHMDTIEVSVGQEVTKGDRIGTVGTTGLSTACHLHFNVYEDGQTIDPLKYISQ